MPGNHRLFTGVHQQEAAGSIRVFSHAFLKAALPEQRGLLIPSNPRHWDFPVEKMHRRRHGDDLTGRLYLRQHLGWNI